MKKIIALLLAIVMCLSMCACGTTGKNMKDSIVGTWKYYYELTEASVYYENVGDKCVQTIELYKGGTGRIYWYNETADHEGSNVPLTWEIKDDIVNITYDIGVVCNKGYEYDYETDKLKTVDGSRVFERQ